MSIKFISSGCVLDLPMQEGAGTIVYDRTRYHNNGAFGAGAAAPTWVLDPSTGLWVLSFDGNDYITVLDAPSFNIQQYLTFLTWLTTDTLIADGARIASKYVSATPNREWNISLASQKLDVYFGDPADGTFEFTLRTDNNVITNTSLWYQVGWTFNVGTVLVYVNASSVAWTRQAGTPNPPTSLFNGIADLLIGALNGPANFWEGYLVLPRLYSRALSATEIASIYQYERHLFINRP